MTSTIEKNACVFGVRAILVGLLVAVGLVWLCASESRGQSESPDDEGCGLAGTWEGTMTLTDRYKDPRYQSGRTFVLDIVYKITKEGDGVYRVLVTRSGGQFEVKDGPPGTYSHSEWEHGAQETVKFHLKDGVLMVNSEVIDRNSETDGSGEWHRQPAHVDIGDVQGNAESSDLSSILNKAGEKGYKPCPDCPAQPFPKGGDHDLDPMCSQYFREVMREFGNRGFEVPANYTNDQFNANQIIREMRNRKDQWKEIEEAKAQEYANRGVLVEGVYFNPEGSGHLATVSPVPQDLDRCRFPGHGPFIRDGNEHAREQEADGRLYATTWGAAKASRAFEYGERTPTWYVWIPSVK